MWKFSLRQYWTEPNWDGAINVLLQGHMPKHELLQKYDLLQFADVARAVRCDMLSRRQLIFTRQPEQTKDLMYE